MRLRRRRYDVPDSVSRRLKRRRWTRRGAFGALLLLVLSVLLDRFGAFRYKGDDWGNFDRKEVVVTRVVDGDTVRVRATPLADEEAVRLLGIDAPEMRRDDAPGPAHWAPEATARLRAAVQGRTVTLRLDTTETRDKYGRLLAYLYAGDGDNVNLALVRDGHAYAHRSFPHGLRRQFEQAEDEARGKGRGLWAGVAETDMPAWRRRWLADRRERRGESKR
jgi:micrococcal nuclease